MEKDKTIYFPISDMMEGSFVPILKMHNNFQNLESRIRHREQIDVMLTFDTFSNKKNDEIKDAITKYTIDGKLSEKEMKDIIARFHPCFVDRLFYMDWKYEDYNEKRCDSVFRISYNDNDAPIYVRLMYRIEEGKLSQASFMCLCKDVNLFMDVVLPHKAKREAIYQSLAEEGILVKKDSSIRRFDILRHV